MNDYINKAILFIDKHGTEEMSLLPYTNANHFKIIQRQASALVPHTKAATPPPVASTTCIGGQLGGKAWFDPNVDVQGVPHRPYIDASTLIPKGQAITTQWLFQLKLLQNPSLMTFHRPSLPNNCLITFLKDPYCSLLGHGLQIFHPTLSIPQST